MLYGLAVSESEQFVKVSLLSAIDHAGEYQLLSEVYRDDAFRAFRARHRNSDRDVRLTLFNPEISASAAFRAAFRTDQPILSHVTHHQVLTPVFWGDHQGRVYYVTEYPAGRSLAECLAAGESFSVEEAIDIAWQIASALQYMHNLGLTHGGLTTRSVSVCEDVRIQLMGFGLYRWIAAARPGDGHHHAWSDHALQDLQDFGRLLRTLMDSVPVRPGSETEIGEAEQMQRLIEDLQYPAPDLLARDIQGRLGNMLLQVAGESIEMVDRRKGQQLSRRSIVDELFDDPGPALAPTARPPAPASHQIQSSRWLLLLLAVAVVVVVVATILLGTAIFSSDAVSIRTAAAAQQAS
ncbi:MAG: protein kinase [Fuerstiella sp.]